MMNGAPSDDRLREALARRSERAVPTAACPGPGILWDLAAGALDAAKARDAAAHAVGCAACREALRLAREAGATEAARSRGTVPGARFFSPWLAVAAVLVIGIGLFLMIGRPDRSKPPEFRDEPGVRIDAVGPRGPVKGGGEAALAWTAVEGARYDLTLAREDLEVLSVVRGLERPQYTVPASLAARLRPGERLLWQVEAVFPDGRRILSGTFSVRFE